MIAHSKANCLVCSLDNSTQVFYRCIDGVNYYECVRCGSILADQNSKLSTFTYDDDYWKSESIAAKERSFGASINRCAEVFFYSRIPINRFLDIGTGPGYLLDALSTLMPNFQSMFYGIELYPPPEKYQSIHPNYKVGRLSDLSLKFSGGVCIEVIEHLFPNQLHLFVENLARVSEHNAIYYFNSGQPEFVKDEDSNYLDPTGRGHIASYSLIGLKEVFSKYGFTVLPLPGRTWGFLVEFNRFGVELNAEELLLRLWTANSENIEKLKRNGFGELMYAIGLESARCYLESAIAKERVSAPLSSLENRFSFNWLMRSLLKL